MIWWCLFCIFLIQANNAVAQVISYVPRNGIPSNIVTNQPHNIRTAANLRVPVAANIPNTIASLPLAISGAAPTPATITGNGMMTNAQVANLQLANEITENVVHANQELAAINNANAVNPNLAALAGNIGNFNGNFATFNVGNAFSVTSGSPGNQGFGIKLLAEALEVGGTVAVNGQIPIFGTVAINGNVATDGAASVNYGSGRQAAVTSVTEV